VAIVAYFYKFNIIDLLYRAHTPYSSEILGILMIGFLFVSASYLYGTLLTANHNLRQLNIAAAITVVLNIGLNLILIPRHQALGAAIASLISQGFYASAQMILSARLLQIPANGDIFIRLAAFLAFNLLAGYLTRLLPGWIPGILLLTLSCTGSAFLLRLFRISEIRDILNEI